jgi:peptidoglycan/LPS O-acetylase OafA/YrhL
MNDIYPRGHLPVLDGVRGLAILMVLVFHFVGTTLATNAVERVIVGVTNYGAYGVELFFVLSGFLITGILYDAREKPNYFRNFFMRRVLRIFPLYYGVLFVLLVLIPRSLLEAHAPEALIMRDKQGWLWSYLTNVYVAKEGTFAIPYVSHFWTLAIEEHFYLFWPLVIRLANRKSAMGIAVGLSVMALGLRLVLRQVTHNEMWAQVLTPSRLDSLCIGAWFALAIRGPDGPAAIGRNLRTWLLASAGVLVLLMAVPKSVLAHDLNLPLKETALAVFCAVVIFAAAWRDGPAPLKAAMRLSFLRLFGKYSYGLYVFHAILAYGAWRHRTAVYLEPWVGSFTAAALVQAVLGSALSLAIAMASYHLFEVRFLALKKWFKA